MIRTTKNLKQANAITHCGTFHADEVFASVILDRVCGDITVFRTFDVPPKEELADGVIIYDIGCGQYDHHQKGGNGFRENGVPYAAAGLIWRDYGMYICTRTPNPKLVWDLIDRDLIQGIDAVDNGKMPRADYVAQALTLSQIISGFNPDWDDTETADEAFTKAAVFAGIVFDNILKNAVSKAKAKEKVDLAIANSEGKVMVLDKFVPWQEFIFSSTNPKAKEIEFVIFPSNRGGYNWQCVPDSIGSFGQRKTVPAEWKGLRDLELQKITGVSSATFCHPAGFIGGARELKDAIALANMAVAAG